MPKLPDSYVVRVAIGADGSERGHVMGGVKEARNEILHGMDMGRDYLATIDAGHAAQLAAAEPVRWADTGLDRVHVATGTVWFMEVDNDSSRGVSFYNQESRSTVERAGNGEWKWTTYKPDPPLSPEVGWAGPRSTRHCGLRSTEAEAMQAALGVAGWEP